jgi:hypothetical protein
MQSQTLRLLMKRSVLLFFSACAGVAVALVLMLSPGARSVDAAGANLNLPQTTCFPDGTASVVFSWSAVAGAQVYWVDISVFDNGFAPNTFLGATSGVSTSLRWDGIQAITPHVWRVNALTAGGWETSATGAFVPCGSPFPLSVNPQCQGRNLTTATFRWAPVSPEPVLQFLDLGWDPNFSPGSFYGLQQPTTAGSVTWPDIPANITQHFRINSLTADGVWRSSPAGSFVGACVPSALGIETPLGDRIIIPAAGVDAEVRSMKVHPSDGLMPDPLTAFAAVMYDFSSFPGLGGYANVGNLIVAAHVDCGGCYNGAPGPAIFANVPALQIGDTAQYQTAAGETYNYVVVFTAEYDPDIDWIPLVGSGNADMTLITCVGNFFAGEYDTRHLVYLQKY